MASNEPESLPPPTDGEYAGYTLVVFTGIFIPVQIMFVGLRFYARYTLHAWGWDDLIVLVSLVMQLIIGALCIGKLQFICTASDILTRTRCGQQRWCRISCAFP